MDDLGQLLGLEGGRIMLTRRCTAGFSLIELMVGLVIMALLLGLGLPSLSSYLANNKIRATASNFSADLQFARAEAIRRNGNVGLVLTSDAPTAANANSATPSAAGPNWMVRLLTPGAPATYSLLQGKSAAEGSTQVVVAGGVSHLNFTGLVSSDLAATVSFDFSNPSGGACVLPVAPAVVGGPMRCLRVQVTVGGQVRVCDPAVVTVGDARTCS